MKIRSVTTCVIEANFDWTIVKITTDEAATGYGEAFPAPALSRVIGEFAPLLVGEDPRNVDRIFRKMRTAGAPSGSSGMILHAISGIEAALWDLLGKKLGVPVYQLLGGRYRDRIRIYADCHAGAGLESLSPVLIPRTPSWAGEPEPSSALDLSMKHHGSSREEHSYPTPEDYARRAREMAEQGFTALKFDVDVPNPHTLDDYNRSLTRQEMEFMRSLVEAAYRELGGEVELAVDCHWNFNVSDALRLAWACEEFQLLWLEDPVPPENLQALRQVTQSTRIPIATGENHYLRHQFRDLLEGEALNIAAPDIQKVGGLMEARRIADLADLYAVALAPHNIASPIGTMAAAHVCAAIPNFLCLEWHGATVPFFDRLVRHADGPLIRDGYIPIPEKPGLGIELDEDVAHQYRKRGEAFFGD